ncbi:hypothetical protein [Arhodomonas sp. AD133]|uniref:hypothetical protein n=1 Tax=Arhodomonas sp. AD133 TaxID=3415009 RepID=UPI003EB9EC67
MVKRAKGREDGVRLCCYTKLDAQLEAALLSFYGWLGLTDVYWLRVKPALDPGPGLLVLATHGEWPRRRQEMDTVRLVLYAQPYDRETAQLGPLSVGQQHKLDLGLMAGALKAGLNELLHLGMGYLRYEVPVEPPYFRRLLTDAGFTPDPNSTDPDRCPMFGPISGVQEKLGIEKTTPEKLIDPGFGADPTHDRLACLLSGLQIGGERQPPGVVVNPGVFRTPDGGVPEPGVPPAPPPPGPDAGGIFRESTLGPRTRR